MENPGTKMVGRTKAKCMDESWGPGPATITAMIPAAKAARTGGATFATAGKALAAINAVTIASAVQKLSSKPVMILSSNGRNTAQTIPITIGRGHKLMTLPIAPEIPSTVIRMPAAILDLREAEVIERRTDEDGTWDRPGNATGLAVQITRHNGQQSWNRVGAKYPCRDLVVFKVSLRRDGKENGERACDGEKPSNHSIGGRVTVQRRAKSRQLGSGRAMGSMIVTFESVGLLRHIQHRTAVLCSAAVSRQSCGL